MEVLTGFLFVASARRARHVGRGVTATSPEQFWTASSILADVVSPDFYGSPIVLEPEANLDL
eukprot:3663122-Karenia_brevis.AAC.1